MDYLKLIMESIKTVIEKVKEWARWSPYHFWQYGLSLPYFKNMIYGGLVMFSCFKEQNKLTRWLVKENYKRNKWKTKKEKHKLLYK